MKPVVVLEQNDVHGHQLNSNLIISPNIHLGIPEATVTWSHNDQALDLSNPRVTVSGGGDLTVTGVQTSDRGVYTIIASNSAAPDGVMASVNVSINCKESLLVLDVVML